MAAHVRPDWVLKVVNVFAKCAYTQVCVCRVCVRDSFANVQDCAVSAAAPAMGLTEDVDCGADTRVSVADLEACKRELLRNDKRALAELRSQKRAAAAALRKKQRAAIPTARQAKRQAAALEARAQQMQQLAKCVPDGPLDESEVIEVVFQQGGLTLGRLRLLKAVNRAWRRAARRTITGFAWQHASAANLGALRAAFLAVRAVTLPAPVLLPSTEASPERIVVLRAVACAKKRDQFGQVVVEAAETTEVADAAAPALSTGATNGAAGATNGAAGATNGVPAALIGRSVPVLLLASPPPSTRPPTTAASAAMYEAYIPLQNCVGSRGSGFRTQG